jgi:hypothetical protein
MTPGTSDGDLDIDVADAGEYVRIRFKGIINPGSQMRLVDRICEINAVTGKGRFLVDARGCTIDYPMIERYRIGVYAAEKFGTAISAAYIIEQQHNTGLVENTAQNRGSAGVRIASTELDAIEWLLKERGA